jgi:HSP20 family protein
MNKTEESTAVQVVENGKESSGGLQKTHSPAFVAFEKMFERLAEITRDTAHKAYDFFQKRGGELGNEIQDWFDAESKILRSVAVEITESNGSVNVSAAVPGFKPDEIEISVKDDVLIVSGKTEKREEKEEENLVYSDWESNQFFRQFTLPSFVDPENAKAELKDGILRLTLPKAAAEKPKQIAVKAG